MNKKLYTLITCLFLLILTSSALAQNYYSILGSSDGVRWIIRIEALDSESHTPIKDARITLNDEPSKRNILTLMTDSEGVGVIFVKEVRYIPGALRLKVIAPGYKYWEKEIYQSDFFEEEKERKLVLTNKNPWTWTDLNAIPSDTEIIQEIKNRNFRIWTDDNMIYYGPGIFEFNIKMEKVPKKINID